ncbi:MAG: prolyl oligopeptidase family serine peptidase [Isosphaeraceae bacterium]
MPPARMTTVMMTCFLICASSLALGLTEVPGDDNLAIAAEAPGLVPPPGDPWSPPRQAQGGPRSSSGLVLKERIDPHWFDDNTSFWYRNDLAEGRREFILVDARQGTRAPAFDRQRLAAALARASGSKIDAARLPFDVIALDDHGKTLRFKFGETVWRCDLARYDCNKAAGAEAPTESPARASSRRGSFRGNRDRTPRRFGEDGRSPDGKWTAFVKDHDLYLRVEGAAEPVRLSSDGKEGLAYGRLSWSPDSRTLIAFRIEPGDRKEVYLIQSSPPGGGRAKLRSRPYPLPGDKYTAYELNLFGIASKKQMKPKVDRIDFDEPRLRWCKDDHHFTYEKIDRGHQRFRVVEVDARTGEARNLIDETSSTFIWTAHAENVDLDRVNWLDRSDEIVYASERDGWRRLYLVDAKKGTIKNPITRGEYVVRGIDLIDEDKRQVWFHAGGKNAGQDPYFLHYYRVNFDGTGLVALTEGNGNHSARFSPDRTYLIDTYSRVDLPPVHELRRTSDGSLVRKLEEADISALKAIGWKPPEVFVARGRDGKTDIWGIIARPRDFDPARKYPVIESIYAGPQGSFVPKSFSSFNRYASLTDLGFIVVQIDGMGTANRSKAFHDVCWHNLKDAGFPDRILWHKAVAAKYPSYDLSRLGIYGVSAGGQNATGGVLFHPEFYKVAVSACGCHDNRMDKASWNEQWMGYPVGPWYAESSNIDNAHRLRGKLLLIVGEMDTNVPPESTLRLVDALIRAGKDFELVVVPGANHGMGGAYGLRRMQDFFLRNLLGKEPPDRNAGEPRAAHPATGTIVTTPSESFFQLVSERDREPARKFYKKSIEVDGMPVVASGEVADLALVRTREIVRHMLAGRPDVVRAMVRKHMYLIVIGKDQAYTEIPEYRHLPNPAYWNERVRGTGGRPTSFGEENVLSLPLDRYDDESIAVHEFAHTIDGTLRSIDPAWRERLRSVYQNAVARDLYKNAYAAGSPGEYWAEIVQSYFDCNRVNNWNHGPIGTREQLKVHDPEGYELARTTFRLGPEHDWRYTPLRKLPSVTPPPARLKIDPFYTKFTWAREFHVVGRGASDRALLKANDTVRKLFAYRHDLLKALLAAGVKLAILGPGETISQLPEYRGDQGSRIDRLPRYLEYSPETRTVVVGEENVLGDPDQPGVGPNQVIRVLARALHDVAGTRPIDPNWDRRGSEVQQYELRVKRLDVRFDEALQHLFKNATRAGKWKGTAAARDRIEYWATGVLAYFSALGQSTVPGGALQPIRTREDLKAYDPDLYALVNQTLAYEGHVDWRFAPSRPIREKP